MNIPRGVLFGALVGGIVAFMVAMLFYSTFGNTMAFIIVPIGIVMGVAPLFLKPLDEDE